MSYNNNLIDIISKLEKLIEKDTVNTQEIDFILRRVITEAELILSEVTQKLVLEEGRSK